MPTANTQAIIDGADFKEYAKICARSFGALIHMRDEPFDAPITLPVVSEYHANRISESTALLKFLDASSPEIFWERAKEEYQKDLEHYNQSVEKVKEIKAKYDLIQEQAENWACPSKDHEEFKKFMVSQIADSRAWDCKSYAEKPKLLTGEEWRKKMLEKATKDLAYHTAELEKEQKRVAQRTEWIVQLQESLA